MKTLSFVISIWNFWRWGIDVPHGETSRLARDEESRLAPQLTQLFAKEQKFLNHVYYIESFNSDFDFFPLDCHAALGIADGTIPDDKMFASSILSVNDKAHLGRLNFGGAWSAAVNDVNQYLGIDLGEDFTVTGIETQGSSDKATWVTKYTLQYKTASDHSSYYTEIMQGQERMKVDSVNGYLSIIMIIYTTQPARCDESIQLGSMISLIGTRAIVGRTFSFFPSKCWPQH